MFYVEDMFLIYVWYFSTHLCGIMPPAAVNFIASAVRMLEHMNWCRLWRFI